MNFIVRAMRKIVVKIGTEEALVKFDEHQAEYESQLIVDFEDAFKEAFEAEIEASKYEKECIDLVISSSNSEVKSFDLFENVRTDVDTSEGIDEIVLTINREIKHLNSKKKKSKVVLEDIRLLRSILVVLDISCNKTLALRLSLLAIQSRVRG